MQKQYKRLQNLTISGMLFYLTGTALLFKAVSLQQALVDLKECMVPIVGAILESGYNIQA